MNINEKNNSTINHECKGGSDRTKKEDVEEEGMRERGGREGGRTRRKAEEGGTYPEY